MLFYFKFKFPALLWPAAFKFGSVFSYRIKWIQTNTCPDSSTILFQMKESIFVFSVSQNQNHQFAKKQGIPNYAESNEIIFHWRIFFQSSNKNAFFHLQMINSMFAWFRINKLNFSNQTNRSTFNNFRKLLSGETPKQKTSKLRSTKSNYSFGIIHHIFGSIKLFKFQFWLCASVCQCVKCLKLIYLNYNVNIDHLIWRTLVRPATKNGLFCFWA